MFSLAALVLVLIPFLDRKTARGEPTRLWSWLAVGALIYIFVLTW